MVTDQPIRIASEPWRQLGVLTDDQYALIRPIVFGRLGNPHSQGADYITATDIVCEFVAKHNAALGLRNRLEAR